MNFEDLGKNFALDDPKCQVPDTCATLSLKARMGMKLPSVADWLEIV